MVTKIVPPEITEIDLLARQYADAQMALNSLTNDLKIVIDAAVRERWAELRKATTRAAERYDALLVAVSDAPKAFDKPKTRLMHSIRVGFRKAADSVQVLNAENTCALIKKHLPDQSDLLISTTEKPVIAAIEGLEDAPLKLIGCRRVIGKDEPVVKLADTDIDKVVAMLTKGAIEKAEAA